MNDEEKKAIEVLNYIKNKTPFIFWYEDKPYNRKETINTILNLIEKQSKEIEELKEEKAIYYYEWNHLEANVINKIQEYDDKEMTVNLVNRRAGKTFQQAVHYEVKKILQSLLEKE